MELTADLVVLQIQASSFPILMLLFNFESLSSCTVCSLQVLLFFFFFVRDKVERIYFLTETRSFFEFLILYIFYYWFSFSKTIDDLKK